MALVAYGSFESCYRMFSLHMMECNAIKKHASRKKIFIKFRLTAARSLRSYKRMYKIYFISNVELIDSDHEQTLI